MSEKVMFYTDDKSMLRADDPRYADVLDRITEEDVPTQQFEAPVFGEGNLATAYFPSMNIDGREGDENLNLAWHIQGNQNSFISSIMRGEELLAEQALKIAPPEGFLPTMASLVDLNGDGCKDIVLSLEKKTGEGVERGLMVFYSHVVSRNDGLARLASAIMPVGSAQLWQVEALGDDFIRGTILNSIGDLSLHLRMPVRDLIDCSFRTRIGNHEVLLTDTGDESWAADAMPDGRLTIGDYVRIGDENYLLNDISTRNERLTDSGNEVFRLTAVVEDPDAERDRVFGYDGLEFKKVDGVWKFTGPGDRAGEGSEIEALFKELEDKYTRAIGAVVDVTQTPSTGSG